MPRFTIVSLLALTALVAFVVALAANEPALLVFLGTVFLGIVVTFAIVYALYGGRSKHGRKAVEADRQHGSQHDLDTEH